MRWVLVGWLALALVACTQSPTAMPAPAATATRTPVPTTSTLPPPVTAIATGPTGATGTAITPAGGPTPSRGAASSPAVVGPVGCAPGVDFLGFSDALDKARFAETNVGGLSALVYDAAHDVYYSLVDNERDTPARLYTLRLPLDGGTLGTPEILAVTTLRNADGQPFNGRNFDGEGMALLPDGNLLISSETEPSIRRFAPDGRQIDQLPVPPRFLIKPNGEASENLTFESLALAPDGAALFTVNEGPLAPDGFAGLSARVRLLRYDRQADNNFAPAAQFFYLADLAQGISDVVALSATDLLVLERGFIPGVGNTIRIYRVSLAGALDVTNRPSLADADLRPLPKTLLADLINCPASGAQHPAKQPTPLLDNFESLALGPRLPDGRRSLLLQSDDNFGRDQVTRVIGLAFGR